VVSLPLLGVGVLLALSILRMLREDEVKAGGTSALARD
jgi:hypothetical protein